MAIPATSRDRGSQDIAHTLQVADLARRADVTPATVRYYARVGLLKPDRDEQNGYRMFSREDLRRVVFIRKAQALGLTIADVRTILDAVDHGQPVCEQVVELVHERLDEIRRQCAELEATKARIERALEQWSAARRGHGGYCPLIEQVELARDGDATAPASTSRLRVVPGACLSSADDRAGPCRESQTKRRRP